MPLDHTWLHDLVDPNDQVRHRALDRQRAHVAGARQARRWSNAVWAQAGKPAPQEPPHLAAEWDRAEAEFRHHQDHSFTGPISAFLNKAPDQDSASFALLYLHWETRYPLDWQQRELNMWSPWGTKESLLRRFGQLGVADSLRGEVADLIVTAIRRPYRCKDWRYARLVDHVCDDAFRTRVNALTDAPDPLVAARARFVRYVADHPGRPLNRNSWRHWSRS